MLVPCVPSYLFYECVNWCVSTVILCLSFFGKWLMPYLEFLLFGFFSQHCFQFYELSCMQFFMVKNVHHLNIKVIYYFRTST